MGIALTNPTYNTEWRGLVEINIRSHGASQMTGGCRPHHSRRFLPTISRIQECAWRWSRFCRSGSGQQSGVRSPHYSPLHCESLSLTHSDLCFVVAAGANFLINCQTFRSSTLAAWLCRTAPSLPCYMSPPPLPSPPGREDIPRWGPVNKERRAIASHPSSLERIRRAPL